MDVTDRGGKADKKEGEGRHEGRRGGGGIGLKWLAFHGANHRHLVIPPWQRGATGERVQEGKQGRRKRRNAKRKGRKGKKSRERSKEWKEMMD